MDFFKKAKSQMKSAANQAQGYAQQFQGQPQPQQPQQPQGGAYPYSHQASPPPNHPQQQQHQEASYQQSGYYGQYPQQHSSYPQQNPHSYSQQPGYSQAQQAPQAPQYHQQPQTYQQPQQSAYPQQYGYTQYAPNSQTGYQHPPAQSPPSQTFNTSHMSQALPAAPPRQSPAPQSYVPQPPAPHQGQPAPAPAPAHSREAPAPVPSNPHVTAANAHTASHGTSPRGLQPCPGHGTGSTDETGSLEVYTFYVFQEQIIKQGSSDFEADLFAICGACYTQAISPYPQLASTFRHREKKLAGQTGQTVETLPCKFALPRVRQAFYNECVRQNSIQPLVQFARLNSTLTVCPKFDVKEDTEYYTSRTLGNLAVCKTCFEQYFRTTPFEYEMYIHAAVSGWGCDVGYKGFVFKALAAELISPRPDFRRFAAQVQHRLEICCPGEENTIWPVDQQVPPPTYEPQDGSEGIFCEACYLDKIHGTRVDHFYNKRVVLGPEFQAEFQGSLTCNLASLPSKFAMDVADKLGDPKIWQRCMSRRGNLPKCEGVKGVDEVDLTPDSELWYKHKEHPSIEICPICICSTIELFGALPMFEPITRQLQPGVIRMCFLAIPKDLNADDSNSGNFENTLVWRGIILRRWLQQGYAAQNDFVGFKYCAKMVAGWGKPCAGGLRKFPHNNGRKWYGNAFYIAGDESKGSVIMCEECWDDYVKGTVVENVIGNDRTESLKETLPDGCMCSLVTQRCKDRLGEGCRSGDLHPFLSWWAKRQEVALRRMAIHKRAQEQIPKVLAYKAQLDMQGAMMATNLMQQLNANMNATIGLIGGSVAEASATDYGQRYGNSAVGYGYLTHNGAAAAQATLDAQNYARKGVSIAEFSPSGDVMGDTNQLIALQSAVDKEWAEWV